MSFNRIILVVMDSVGIGAMPDAERWGDAGSNTLGNTLAVTGVYLPHFHRLGLGNIAPLAQHPPLENPTGSFGRAALASEGKDTTVGHWEMAGIITATPFPTYPAGFPAEVLDAFEKEIGRSTLGNYPASGTEIIEKLGDAHVRTGSPIVYTSADSVFQIAAHEEVIPLPELYRICHVAREILQGPHCVARVIARPFVGAGGRYTRTANRKDFAVPPPEPNLFSLLESAGRKVVSIGKIASIYAWRHTGQEIKTKDNRAGIEATLDQLRSGEADFIMTNLVDFDMLFGHRNDAAGYAAALLELDGRLPELLGALREDDCLILTADHGCDPTTASTDHSREYVPILCWSPAGKGGRNLGIRDTLADLGQSVAANFGLRLEAGMSFLEPLLERD